MQTNAVSVIIPNYNHASFLKQRIDSVLSQTFKDFELIILDDYSSDNSREIIEQYRNNSKVSNIVYNDINSGSTFKQWEKGIELSKGKYIWIAESDDWCEPSFLETLVRAFDKNDRLSVAYVQSYYMLGLNKIKWISKNDELESTVSGPYYIKKYLSKGNSIFNASMALFSKEKYHLVSKEYTRYKFSGDWLFWCEMASKGDVYISGKVLNFFRNHEGDVSGKAYQTGLNFIEEFNVLVNLIDNELINEIEFYDSIERRYLKYISNKNNFTKEVQDRLNELFYKNIYTKKYRLKLKMKWFKENLNNKFRLILSNLGS